MVSYAEVEGVRCEAETASALKVVTADTALWVPKSLVSEDSEVSARGDEGTLLVEEWLAVREGLV